MGHKLKLVLKIRLYIFSENTEMLKIVSITIIVTVVVSSGDAQNCLGCASDAAVDENIVNFAVTELAGSLGGGCKRDVVKVENFKKQIVAGNLYKFDLVLKHSDVGEDDLCKTVATNPGACHMEVYEVPWLNEINVVWENVNCTSNQLK